MYRYMKWYDRSTPPLLDVAKERRRFTVPGLFEEWMPKGTSFLGTDYLLISMHPTGDRADSGNYGAVITVLNRGGSGSIKKIFRLVDDMSSRTPLNISASGIAVVRDWIYVTDDTMGRGTHGHPRANRLYAFKTSDVEAGLARGSAPEDLAIGTLEINQQKAVFDVDVSASGLFYRDFGDQELWVFENHRPED